MSVSAGWRRAMTRCWGFLVFLALVGVGAPSEHDTCEKGDSRGQRYLLYDVNPGEGFNLRRDVYLRIANFARKLNEEDNWILVLPPWGRLYHWMSTYSNEYVPWSNFFDVKSLNKWTPVIEFHEFLKVKGPNVQEAYMLQHYSEGWNGKWEEKFDVRPCLEHHSFIQDPDGSWNGRAWGVDIRADNFSCISFQGEATFLKSLIADNKKARSVLVTRAENVLHNEYGGKWYWSARRSMRFASHLRSEANNFRLNYLDSDDVQDGTEMADDWRDHKPKKRTAVGGPYISVHLRRRDFVHVRGDEIPSIKTAAKMIKELLKKKDLQDVFIATDAPVEEFLQLKSLLKQYRVHRYEPSPEFFEQWGDGGVAIVDQIICSHARYFTGSFESTFSFRIQEEREILGFPMDTTFNRLCGKKPECEQPAKWTIVY